MSRAKSFIPIRPVSAISRRVSRLGSLIGSITLSLAGGVRVARLLIGATLAWYTMLLVFVEIRTMPVAWSA